MYTNSQITSKIKLLLMGALILLLTPLLVSALGLGNAHIISKLNEPLNIELELLVSNPKELQNMLPSIASPQDFERAGIDRPYFINTIQFKVETQAGKSIIRLTTTEPVKEPVVNLLVELNSSQGRILKDYTVLLDPPELAPRINKPQAIAQKVVQNESNNQNSQNNNAVFDAFEEQIPAVSVNVKKPNQQNEGKQQAQNEALQGRLGKIEQQLATLSEEKAEAERAKLALKEENDNLHDLVQTRQKEIEHLKEQQVAKNPVAPPAHASAQPPQQRSDLSNFAKNQMLTPAEPDPQSMNPSASAPWLLLGLILTIMLSAIIGLREFLKRKEISIPFDVTLPAFPFGLKENKLDKETVFKHTPPKNQQINQQAFQGAISSIQAAEEKQIKTSETAAVYANSQPVAQVVIPTLDDAEIYITFSKFKMAEEIINKILDHDPNNIQARLKLIDLMFAQEKLEEADKQFKLLPQDFEKGYPKEYQDYKSRIDVLKAAAAPDDIAPELEQTLEEIAPENQENNVLEPPTELSEGFASSSATTTNTQSVSEAEPVLEQDPAIFQTKLDFAKVYIDMKDMESARDLLNEVIEAGPEELKAEAQALIEKTKL